MLPHPITECRFGNKGLSNCSKLLSGKFTHFPSITQPDSVKTPTTAYLPAICRRKGVKQQPKSVPRRPFRQRGTFWLKPMSSIVETLITAALSFSTWAACLSYENLHFQPHTATRRMGPSINLRLVHVTGQSSYCHLRRNSCGNNEVNARGSVDNRGTGGDGGHVAAVHRHH